MSGSGEIQNWVDPAMYAAEAMPQEARNAPKVHLLWMTPDPLGAAAACNAMYTGKVRRSLSDVTRAEREAILGDMAKTILTTPLEAVSLHLLIEGVTRAFTHQLVRNRTSGYAQESLRFAVMGAKEGGKIPVGLPPSLVGTKGDEAPGCENSTGEYMRNLWEAQKEMTEQTYLHLIGAGMPAEDARGLLPTNTLTRIHWVTNLRSLKMEAGKRLSTQAQFEWKAVVAAIARAIREYNPYRNLAKIVVTEHEEAHSYINTALEYLAQSDRWQYEGISDLFRPICYQTGKCEFMSSADRSCTIRSRVEANHAIGRPSSQWHKPYKVAVPIPLGLPLTVEQMDMGGEIPFRTIEAILPVEWLADPTAAR